MADQLDFLGDSDEPASVGKHRPRWYTQAVEAYNEVAKRLKWRESTVPTDKRERSLKKALPVYGGLEGWKVALARAERSSFLTGKSKPGNGHEAWKPSLDFFLQEKSMVTLLEGGYDDRPTAEIVKMEGWREKQAREAREAVERALPK
jgi:hypothetical protein